MIVRCSEQWDNLMMLHRKKPIELDDALAISKKKFTNPKELGMEGCAIFYAGLKAAEEYHGILAEGDVPVDLHKAPSILLDKPRTH